MNILDLHKKTWDELSSRRDRLPHALLLSGQRGIGKFAVAKDFAASLLCENPDAQQRACGHCLACNWFAQGNHPDFRLLQPEAMTEISSGEEEGKKKASKEILIDQVRALDEFLGVGSHRGGLSIVLVNPAEAMNRNAANSILKILEEPPASILFLLVSDEQSRLLPTIRSRCQSILIGLPETPAAQAYLRASGIDDAERWLALSGGAPRLALELAEKNGSGQGSWLPTLLTHLKQGAQHDPLRAAGDIDKLLREQKGALSLRQIIDTLQKWLIDLTQAANSLPVRYFLANNGEISALAAKIPSTRLVRAYRKLATQRREAEQPVNGRLFLEGVFLDYRDLFSPRPGE